MNLEFSKSFEKQLKGIPDNISKEGVAGAIKEIIEAKTVSQIPSAKKMKGHKSAYRIRIGDYRLGFYIDKGVALITTLAHRKDIYKKFP
ncbi:MULTISPECIES: type II toxin-antitoxin system RelE/ParE family toxin [Imperialibacter]|uniref:Type II toxin-antitoxin system RelE/ParE family toxin n=1 Tax=Imperialibacter roseus TaxID=1324217 RepID=A0ABZ0IWP6_9BACT|nr:MULTISPECIES: type II toxin-antitoxin system RelE/ParE family toxin [Imperialibacter]WOK08350.1 type II toxin-antitoxin system RelE/ParE family toxin [Imperialibacter roseus]CAD5253559.1 putative toxin RelE2 [Imperialibacter sp. 89]CAD5275637.1 putative toxin RelE2 [Imperialibacter sp. 75]VVT19892.1 putative toxin RelE2 [Imperialibacter sp. EC-SDR9]